jgi:hypothetical protein
LQIEYVKLTLAVGWVGGIRQRIIPLSGPILQAETCQIFS